MYSDIIIIGGGAAGLFAAIGAGSISNGASVTLLEKMPRPGRKIMITGKGRCNFSNLKDWNDFSGHIRSKSDFVRPSFYNMPPEKVMEILSLQGVESVVERGDRLFPVSHRSMDVVDALARAAKQAGCVIRTGFEVKTADYIEEKSEFKLVSGGGEVLTCSRLIIATGGLSYPVTGSTGDGYTWGKGFGHTVKPLFPSLTAIVPLGYKIENTGENGHIDRCVPLSEKGKALCGIKLKNVGLSLHVNGNLIQNEFGDLDFTDGGIEGPIGFGISRNCVKAILDGGKAKVEIDLKYGVDENELRQRLDRLWKEIQEDRRSANASMPTRIKVLLSKLMPKYLVKGFIMCNGSFIKGEGKTAMPDIRLIVKSLQHWTFEIAGYVGYERCVVTAGGISTDEILPKTMESRLVKGLYFCGEVLDIDSDTGGYNLQTAFSTGYLAGLSAARSIAKA